MPVAPPPAGCTTPPTLPPTTPPTTQPTTPRLQEGGAVLFDLCHGGVWLRAVLGVHAVVALALAWQSGSARAWLDQVSLVVVVVLPATLAWLLLVCTLQRRGLAGQGLGTGSVAGAACGLLAGMAWRALAQALFGGLAPDMATLAWSALCGAASGAAFAAAVLHWLRLRERLRQPVDSHARLAELQARIRPHFLFNALNSAIALVAVDPARAEGVLEDLSDLFRAALADVAGGAVSLRDELALARRYLSIEQVRFGERLAVRWTLDPAADAALLPPLVLQPLVENAVRHGIEPSAAGGLLRVSTEVERGEAVIRIVNSLPQAAVAPAPGHGMALRNVRERLGLMHDLHGQFEAGPDGSGQWAVRIAVPLPQGGRE